MGLMCERGNGWSPCSQSAHDRNVLALRAVETIPSPRGAPSQLRSEKRHEALGLGREKNKCSEPIASHLVPHAWEGTDHEHV
jgi:hypothetical protein